MFHNIGMNGFAQGGEALGALFAGVIYAAAPLLHSFIRGIWPRHWIVCCPTGLTVRIRASGGGRHGDASPVPQ